MIPTAQLPDTYRGYRYPGAVIAHAVWLYLRFPLAEGLGRTVAWERANPSPSRLCQVERVSAGEGCTCGVDARPPRGLRARPGRNLPDCKALL